jgi:hypothetical protein
MVPFREFWDIALKIKFLDSSFNIPLPFKMDWIELK